jgi:hypothetical protein
MGIRMALGAKPNDLTAMFVRQGLWLTDVGIACGVAADVVTAVRRELQRSVDLRWNHRMRHCCTVPRMLSAFAPGSDYRPREYPAG